MEWNYDFADAPPCCLVAVKTGTDPKTGVDYEYSVSVGYRTHKGEWFANGTYGARVIAWIPCPEPPKPNTK